MGSPDKLRSRHQPPVEVLRSLAAIALLGVGVGLACWPLNGIDRWQDQLINQLPGFSSSPWHRLSLALALAPIPLVPLLLLLQAGPLRQASGSGLPQLIEALEHPQRSASLLAAKPTLGRLALWAIASLGLLPLGREGPAAQLGAALAHGLGRGRLSSELLAAAAGAGLAGAFNTPLMGVVFVAEELTRSFQAALIWPALLMAAIAALVSGLAGQPLFALGIHALAVPELDQALWAGPIGLGAGLMGALMARLLLLARRLLQPWVWQHPLRTGLLLGIGLALLALLSGGRSCGDGEAVLRQLLLATTQPQPWGGWLALLVVRLLGPVLGLAAGIPGGLIDPAFALGGAFGAGIVELMGGQVWLGVVLGMAGGLAGATQLPVMSLAFTLRMAGAQQLLPGLMLAALAGALAGRWLMAVPIYRALGEQAQNDQTGSVPPSANAIAGSDQ